MTDTANLVGSVLSDRYELLNKIGTGGMAMVYKAHDKVLDRNVAIKILRQSYESESKIVENFIKEARSSASLVHPNVVSVYDVCEYDGLNYMVMELVDGITLKEYIKQNPRMPWQEACDYAIQIGQGIQAAHERGIIHRDIKPQNIIMAPGGVLKVTDFGIAKAMESDKAIAGGTAMGSVHYISPEQARGGYTDFRSDIYSLGIVLYEMLSGRVPFDGDSPVSVALMHIEEEPVNVKCVNLDVPADLAYITMKAMDREQSKRYQNTNQMLEDLRAVLADETLPSLETEKPDFDEEELEPETQKKPIGHDDLVSRGRNTRTKDKLKKQSKKKQKERNAIVLALSTVAAMVLIAAGIFIIMLKPFSNTVPDFTNLLVTEAEALAKKSGYKEDFIIEYSISDVTEEDRIITQFPELGVEAPHTTKITLVVSVGSSGGDIEVPDLTKLTIEEAISNIESLSLVCNSISEYSDEVEAGYVIRQTPVGGTRLNAGDTVTIHYSMGTSSGDESKTKVSVPELAGYTQDKAQSILSSCGLTLGSVTKRTSPKPEGIIITQSPATGTEVNEGTAISIIISAGNYIPPEPVQEEPQPENEEDPEPANNEPQPETPQNDAKVNMYTVRIPADAQNDAVNVQVVAEGVVVHNAIHQKSEGQVTVEIPYSGSVSIQAYIDGAKISDKTVNF